MKPFSPFAALALTIVLVIAGCKKDEASPLTPNTPAPTVCNYTTDIVSVDGTSHAILKYNCKVVGGYIAEFLTDTSAAPTGVALAFAPGSGTPAAGNYLITSDATSVGAGQVYVEYYDPSTAWHGTTDTVKVAANGAARVYTFCSLTLTAGGSNNKTVSLRGTCN